MSVPPLTIDIGHHDCHLCHKRVSSSKAMDCAAGRSVLIELDGADDHSVEEEVELLIEGSGNETEEHSRDASTKTRRETRMARSDR